MATTVNQAFAEFFSNTVNLDPGVTTTARASRDWLRGQLHLLPEKHSDFPYCYEERDIDFGSFSRRTKIRPLDDIDLISCMHAQGAIYSYGVGEGIFITVRSDSRFVDMCENGTYQLNSKKVINRLVKHLAGIPQYRRADIGRNGEAAVLDMGSYDWSFDIVPGFFTSPEADGRTYYLIPDGNGRWKKTDPRIDEERITRINTRHSGWVLNPLRLTKFWNRRGNMPRMAPYLLETMILAHYDGLVATCCAYPDLEFRNILGALNSTVMNPVYDPKGIQGDLNSLSFDERFAIMARTKEDAVVSDAAFAAEKAGEQRRAINLWRRIFGSDFPSYC